MIWSSRCGRHPAEDARDRIEIAFEPLEAIIDPEMAVGKNAPLLHREARSNVLAMREFACGDAAAQMAAAPVRVAGRFRFHGKTPVAIENRACVAEYVFGTDGSNPLPSSGQSVSRGIPPSHVVRRGQKSRCSAGAEGRIC